MTGVATGADALCRIWSRTLNCPVAPDDDFFELGGDSLAAVEIITAVAVELGADLSIADFFETPTPAELADRLVTAASAAQATPGSAGRVLTRASLRQEDVLDLRLTAPQISTGRLVPTRFRVTGSPSTARLAEALRLLALRQEALRSVFERRDDQWAVRIIPAHDADIPFEVVDARDWSEEELDGDILEAGNTPFAEGACLLRGRYYRRAGDDVLLLTTSHLVCDGASMPVLASDLAALYEGTSPPPLAMQYYEIAAMQREALTSGALDESLEYWRRTMAVHGPWPAVRLPGLSGRTSDEPAEAASAGVVLGPSEAAAFGDACGRWGVSLYSGALAAACEALGRVGDDQGDAFGVLVATAGRSWPGANALVGFFADYVTVGLGTMRGGPAAVAQHAHGALAGALRHDLVPRREVRRLAPPELDTTRPTAPCVLFEKTADTRRWSIALPDGELVGARGVPPTKRVRPYPGIFMVAAPLDDGRLALQCEYGVGECEPATAAAVVTAWSGTVREWSSESR